MRYLALGDSYTIGEGVPEAGRWPMQLAARLAAAGVAMAPPRVVAVTGWTTDELAAGMDQAGLAHDWDLVSLLIGVNNQYRGRDEDEYRTQFGVLLGRAIALAGGRPSHVVVVSIPDWGATRFGRGSGRDVTAVGSALDRFNAIARAGAETAGAAFVDITDLSRSHPDELAEDDLHPDARQYTRWVERIVPAARAALAG